MATASSSFCKGSDDLDLTCDVCQHQKKTSIAVSYCETCKEALCQTCDNVHRNKIQTQTHKLLTGDRLIDIKLAKQCREFGNVQDTSHVDDSVPGRKQGTSGPSGSCLSNYKGTSGHGGSVVGSKRATSRPRGIVHSKRTSRSGESVAVHKPGTSKGHGRAPVRVNYSDRDTDTVPSVLDLTMSYVKHRNIGCERVQSVVFMPSGHVVLACHYGGLILLDEYFKQLSELSLYSVCVCKVSDTEVLVAQGNEKQIQFVQVLPELLPKNVLTIGKKSRGVWYHNGEIYVACRDDPGCGEILVMKKGGPVVRRLGFHDGTYMFTEPYDVKVNNAGDKVFVTDYGTHSVTCMDQAGKLLYTYRVSDLRWPTGLFVDRQDNVLVTALWSDNVHAINKEGRKNKIFLTRRDGLNGPRCISYRHDDGLLAIGMRSSKGKSLMIVKTSLA